LKKPRQSTVNRRTGGPVLDSAIASNINSWDPLCVSFGWLWHSLRWHMVHEPRWIVVGFGLHELRPYPGCRSGLLPSERRSRRRRARQPWTRRRPGAGGDGGDAGGPPPSTSCNAHTYDYVNPAVGGASYDAVSTDFYGSPYLYGVAGPNFKIGEVVGTFSANPSYSDFVAVGYPIPSWSPMGSPTSMSSSTMATARTTRALTKCSLPSPNPPRCWVPD
jgi:hypothetical protein